ncbi:recombinase family protein [Methylobacterium sp. Leaf100]|uniref:recombinase family protein n=1 Tax=Methylobacterium sp. Leaf100 TaxID=1736252 RepID=UPI00070086E3|nr:recombinase family protein [Methylobacterium sp. Leaf100]KQP26645.1 resolvase [Methylobacterium sp. Leaf100]
MAEGRYVSYFRVSTGKQGRSGLGLEAQAQTVRERLNGGSWTVVGTFTEVETGTAKRERPELDRALAYCRVMGAKLIVANVSRLTRNPDFMAKLVAAEVEVEFCDMPNVEGPVGTFMLRQLLSVAELEAGMISDRTRKALAAAKARGVKLGGDRGNLADVAAKGREIGLVKRQAKANRRAGDLSGIIAEIRSEGSVTLKELADGLNARGIPAARGGKWSSVQVSRVVARM